MSTEEGLAKLAECRARIDSVDLEILALLNRRTAIVETIGRVKQSLALPIYEPKREDDVFHNVLSHNEGPLPPEAVKRVFERIIDEMRTVQRTRMLER
jgi:chorismate mutase